jgi:hypothetical protein
MKEKMIFMIAHLMECILIARQPPVMVSKVIGCKTADTYSPKQQCKGMNLNR